MNSRLAIFIFFVSGCSGGLLEEMDRTNKDPFDGALQAKCFAREGEVQLIWSEDPGADEYYILRAQDSRTAEEPSWESAYRGRALSWTDKGLGNDERRIYTLHKRRGGRLFESSTAVLGIGSDVVKDLHEPNETREWAVKLSHVIEANVQHYRSYNYLRYRRSLEYFDTDWYYVMIPAGRGARITLTQKGIQASDPVDLKVFSERASRDLENIRSGVPFTFENRENMERIFLFRIKPNVFASSTPGPGGRTVSYELKLESIFLLPSGGTK